MNATNNEFNPSNKQKLLDMKKVIFVMLALMPLFSGCKKENNSDPNSQIKAIAWNSLSTQEKSTVTVNWTQAVVTETTYNEKSAYAVAFKTSDDALLGPITVYVDTDTKAVLGKGLRD